jgi:CheY-like chemotaxis protein
MQVSMASRVVLCVDDEEVLLRLLRTVLETKGYSVLVATDGRQALDIAASQHIDAVILDYLMPGMNGAELGLAIRRLQPDAPIVMFSGSPGVPWRTLTQVDAFVEKGEGVRALLSVLQRLLQPSGAGGPAVRKFPRYRAQVPVVIKVERPTGVSVLRGVSTTVSEGGIGSKLDGELVPGELVWVEFCDPQLPAPLRPRAQVRYRRDDVYGFEFRELSALQQADLRRSCQQFAST